MSHQFTKEELEAIRSNPEHGPFNVEIDVSHHYFFEKPSIVDRMASALGAKEPLIESGDGAKTKMVLREHKTTTFVCIRANGIKDTQDDRAVAQALEEHHEAAGVQFKRITHNSFNRIVAEHIRDGAMEHCSPQDKWLAIRVPGMPDLEKYLNFYFELGE